MPAVDNTPYNVNRKVATFGDYCNNIDAEESELKKTKRSAIKNDAEVKQVPGNRTHKFNKVTRKIDDLSPAEVEDDIESIEDLKETWQPYLRSVQFDKMDGSGLEGIKTRKKLIELSKKGGDIGILALSILELRKKNLV